MATLLLNQFKKRAESFIREKYRTARMLLTDISEAELLVEEVTNSDPVCPDAKTMAIIAEASFDVDDYWRIVDLLHDRLETFDRKRWRKSYKSLVLLEFLILNGPIDFAEEFLEDTDTIEELGKFQYIDEKGFNWGASMEKRSANVLRLLNGGDTLREARLKALRIRKGIQGFGSLTASPASPSSPPTSAATSSLGASSPSSSNGNDKVDLNSLQCSTQGEIEDVETDLTVPMISKIEEVEGSCLDQDCAVIQETDPLLESDQDDLEKKPSAGGLISGIRSKLAAISPSKEANGEKVAYKSFSNTGSVVMRKHDRQFSMGY